MRDARDPWLLHFTHIENLRTIVTDGLLSDSAHACRVECGQPGIKERRRRRAVPCGPRGIVAEYAPFYFAERSPMLFSIVKGQVKDYSGDQTHLIYLVTRLSNIIDHGLEWVATDRNAVLATVKFTDDRNSLATHVDWKVMDAKWWHNTDDDGSRRERRMAELLVHKRVPWQAFTHMACCCESRKTEIEELLRDRRPRPDILVKPGWYFDVPDACLRRTRHEGSQDR